MRLPTWIFPAVKIGFVCVGDLWLVLTVNEKRACSVRTCMDSVEVKELVTTPTYKRKLSVQTKSPVRFLAKKMNTCIFISAKSISQSSAHNQTDNEGYDNWQDFRKDDDTDCDFYDDVDNDDADEAEERENESNQDRDKGNIVVVVISRHDESEFTCRKSAALGKKPHRWVQGLGGWGEPLLHFFFF